MNNETTDEESPDATDATAAELTVEDLENYWRDHAEKVAKLDAQSGGMNDHYDPFGRPCTFGQWGVARNERKFCQIRSTHFAGVHVSTVWLGVSDQKFETAIFREGDPPFHERIFRHETRQDAINFHEKLVKNRGKLNKRIANGN